MATPLRWGCRPRPRSGCIDGPSQWEDSEAMKVLTWGIVIVGAAYLVYCGMMSVGSYFTVAGAVEEALEARTLIERHDPKVVKQTILNTMNKAGAPLQEKDVTVTASERALAVSVEWTIPVVVYKGEAILAIPLSVERVRAQAPAEQR